MNDSTYLALIQNAALLLALAVIFDTTARRWKFGQFMWRKVLLGVVIGGITLLVMNTPWTYGQGLIFDTRSILLGISGLFFGSTPTLIAIVIAAIYRYTLGGAYLTGISVIIATGLIGIAWRKLRRHSLDNLKWWQLYFFGIVLHIVMLALMFTQPFDVAFPLVKKIALPIMSIYPAGTMLLGLFFVNRLRREKAIEDIGTTQVRLKSLVNILQNPAESIQSFLDFALNEAIKLTASKIGYIYLYSEKTKTFTLNSWSKEVMRECTIRDPMTCYELDKTGIWGEAVRQAKPIILNNFAVDHPLKKGYPEGHAALTRFLTIPIFSENQIVAVVGVANKESDYDENDVVQLTLLMDVVWRTTDRKKAIEDLRVSEENYRTLFDQAADGILILNQDNRAIDINHSGIRMLGYSLDEFNQSIVDLLHDPSNSDENRRVQNQLRLGNTVFQEKIIQKKNGESLDVEILANRIPGDKVQIVLRDITSRVKANEAVSQAQEELRASFKVADDSRKALLSVIEDQKLVEEALRKSEESYRSLFENITQGFALHKIIQNDQGEPIDYQFLAVNPAYELLTGLRADEIVGKTALAVLPGLESKWVEIYGKVALTGQSIRFEEFTSALNKYYDISAFSPEKGYFAVVFSDISERKIFEQEIQKLNLELEDRVKQRTAQLELANQELEAFSYSISHDLRAPLRSINGFAQIILEEHNTELTADTNRYFDLIRKSASMMGNLVDDLLNFSRLGRQSLQKTKVSPGVLVEEVLETNQMEIQARKIEVKVGKLPVCSADPALLKQVFANLITNAIKFSKDQPKPKIEIGFSRATPPNTKGGQAVERDCYFVKDNGVGFDMKFYDKLFGVFQRLHRAEDYEGTGVGLAIVDRIIKKHGGSVWAASEIGKGATFYFSLPEEKHGKR